MENPELSRELGHILRGVLAQCVANLQTHFRSFPRAGL